MNKASFEFNTQLKLDVLLSGLTEVTTEYVDQFAWSEFDEIVIPKGVKSIGHHAFSGCINLTSVTIPDGVTDIESVVFSGCPGLSKIRIPNSVKQIGRWVFADCRSLTNIIFEGKTLNEVRSMKYYPWGIEDRKKISVQVIPDLL